MRDEGFDGPLVIMLPPPVAVSRVYGAQPQPPLQAMKRPCTSTALSNVTVTLCRGPGPSTPASGKAYRLWRQAPVLVLEYPRPNSSESHGETPEH